MAEPASTTAAQRCSAGVGALIGVGVMPAVDGLVNHKVLGLHEVRYGVELLPYDVAWNAAGVVLLLLGAIALRRARR